MQGQGPVGGGNHPRSARPVATIVSTSPSATLAVDAATRPSSAPQPARTAVPAARVVEYSKTMAPAKLPRIAPITLPTTGTGTPTTAPTRPPSKAPHPARGDPP